MTTTLRARLSPGSTVSSRSACRSSKALSTSAMEKEELQALAGKLRGEGILAVVREIDTRAFHGSGCAVGHWGLFVPGQHALEAARHVGTRLPMEEAASAPGCGWTCNGQDDAAVEPGE